MSEKLNLLPCPFCGGEARARTTRKMNTDKDTRYYVECRDCYSSSNPWYDLGAKDTEAEAIAAWNARTPDSDGIGGDKELAKYHKQLSIEDAFTESPMDKELVAELEEIARLPHGTGEDAEVLHEWVNDTLKKYKENK